MCDHNSGGVSGPNRRLRGQNSRHDLSSWLFVSCRLLIWFTSVRHESLSHNPSFCSRHLLFSPKTVSSHNIFHYMCWIDVRLTRRREKEIESSVALFWISLKVGPMRNRNTFLCVAIIGCGLHKRSKYAYVCDFLIDWEFMCDFIAIYTVHTDSNESCLAKSRQTIIVYN